MLLHLFLLLLCTSVYCVVFALCQRVFQGRDHIPIYLMDGAVVPPLVLCCVVLSLILVLPYFFHTNTQAICTCTLMRKVMLGEKKRADRVSGGSRQHIGKESDNAEGSFGGSHDSRASSGGGDIGGATGE